MQTLTSCKKPQDLSAVSTYKTESHQESTRRQNQNKTKGNTCARVRHALVLISVWPACPQLQKKPKKLQLVSLTHFLHPDKGLFPPSEGGFLQNNEVLKDNYPITDCPDRSHPQTFQIYIDIPMTKVNLFCIAVPLPCVCEPVV